MLDGEGKRVVTAISSSGHFCSAFAKRKKSTGFNSVVQSRPRFGCVENTFFFWLFWLFWLFWFVASCLKNEANPGWSAFFKVFVRYSQCPQGCGYWMKKVFAET